MINTIPNTTKGAIGVSGIIAVILAMMCVVPMVALWALNTLAELGGSLFYVEHSALSYFVTFVIVALLRGDSSK